MGNTTLNFPAGKPSPAKLQPTDDCYQREASTLSDRPFCCFQPSSSFSYLTLRPYFETCWRYGIVCTRCKTNETQSPETYGPILSLKSGWPIMGRMRVDSQFSMCIMNILTPVWPQSNDHLLLHYHHSSLPTADRCRGLKSSRSWIGYSKECIRHIESLDHPQTSTAGKRLTGTPKLSPS